MTIDIDDDELHAIFDMCLVDPDETDATLLRDAVVQAADIYSERVIDDLEAEAVPELFAAADPADIGRAVTLIVTRGDLHDWANGIYPRYVAYGVVFASACRVLEAHVGVPVD